MALEIGLQLWSVRNSLQQDYFGTLEKAAEIGYKNLELITTVTADGLKFGQGMRTDVLRKNLDRLGLRAVSCHFVPNPEMRLDRILEDLKILEVDSLVCAIALFNNPHEVAVFNTTFNQYAETCKKNGVQLYYHNHFHEFQVFGGKTIFEMMIEQMEKDLVKFELDTYWAVRGGQDPIHWLNKLGKRCDLLHQKDLPVNTRPINLFEMTGHDEKISMDAIWKILDPKQFIEIGEGVLNIRDFIQISRAHNQARFIFVEQDLTQLTELESIALSFANLTRLVEE